MKTEQKGFFKDATVLAEHLKYKDPTITPLRLQKTLYFLFAFYGRIYGSRVDNQGVIGKEYPKYLFDEDFEAWKFGPVLKSIYEGNRESKIDAKEYKVTNQKEEKVLNMVDSAVKSINKLGDFELVERTHQDNAWKNAIKENETYGIMDRKEILDDYKRV